MTDDVLIQLKILVERAVRPVRAPLRRKLRMREELLAHVIAVYEEESAIAAAGALARTQQRFGEPADLTDALDATVPAVERLVAHVQHYLCRRPGESGWRFAGRHAFAAGLYTGGSALVGFLITALLIAVSVANDASAWIGLATLIPVAFVLAVTAVLLSHGIWQSLFAANRRAWKCASLLLLTSAAVGPLVLLAIMMQLTGDLFLAFQRARPGIPLVALLPPMLFVFAADLVRRATADALGRSWLYTMVVDTGLAAVLALAIFGLALLLGADFDAGLEQARVMVCVVLTWLLPLDLLVTSRGVLSRLSASREWANLKLD